ncbi:MAG: family 20 glycosylhydrolase [Planctomycetota bacterium]|nr:family 20 glycosylhydrolase [Planctomycetota bacterium]
MAQNLDSSAAAGIEHLRLLPFPRYVTLHGAPLRPAPSNYLYVSTEATVATRRRCYVLGQRLHEIGFRTTLDSSSRLSAAQALFTPSASFPKWEGLDRPLRAQSSGPEGYRLTATADGVLLHGADDQGLQHAGATLRQLLQDGPEIPGLEIEDFPLLSWRVMHLDFKGWPPTVAYLKQVMSALVDLKVNALILEYEAHYNFPSQPGLASENAFTATEATELEVHAQDLGVTLIPLVPCLGNAGHVLRLPAYAALREHPQYTQQYCPVHPETLGVVTAMMEDLTAVHHSKYFHIGGDDNRLLGTNAASEARAKQLGGRAALFLDYVGKVCRYLMAGGRQPLLWDDMFRKMSDAQVRWLPPEVILTFWQYEGQGGRATPAILANLDRYKRLGRRVWGAATRTPTVRYDSFDNIDAWTEAAEMGYLEGLITTARTRDHTCGALYAPPEIAWPGAFYAAERMWSGRKGLSREQFPQRFVTRLFGTKDPAVHSRLWAGFDLLLREHPRRAREFFAQDIRRVGRNAATLAFMESWSVVNAFKEYVGEFEAEVSGDYANLVAGNGDPFHSGRLRFRVQDLKSKLPGIIGSFQKQAQRLTNAAQVQEYLESSVAHSYKKLEEMATLLARYPLPPEEWQQHVNL